jgi:hypothetical protein
MKDVTYEAMEIFSSDLSGFNNVVMIDILFIICTITRDIVAPVLQSITAEINHLTATNTPNTPT